MGVSAPANEKKRLLVKIIQGEGEIMNKVKISFLIILNAALTGIFITLVTWIMQFYVRNSIDQMFSQKLCLPYITKLMTELSPIYFGISFWLAIVTYSLFVWKFTCWDEKTIQKVFRATWLILLSYFCYLAAIILALYLPQTSSLHPLGETSSFQSFSIWIFEIWIFFIPIVFCFFLGRALWNRAKR